MDYFSRKSLSKYLTNTIDKTRAASYIDLHLEIDSESQLRTKLYDNRDNINFPNQQKHQTLELFSERASSIYESGQLKDRAS
jgi:DNA-dependent RNA polymerase auxiliary subunit epsilon